MPNMLLTGCAAGQTSRHASPKRPENGKTSVLDSAFVPSPDSPERMGAWAIDAAAARKSCALLSGEPVLREVERCQQGEGSGTWGYDRAGRSSGNKYCVPVILSQ